MTTKKKKQNKSEKGAVVQIFFDNLHQMNVCERAIAPIFTFNSIVEGGNLTQTQKDDLWASLGLKNSPAERIKVLQKTIAEVGVFGNLCSDFVKYVDPNGVEGALLTHVVFWVQKMQNIAEDELEVLENEERNQ